MKIVALVFLVLLAAVAAVVAIGSRLPVAHRAARSATYRQPPDKVRAAISDFAAQPSWRAGLSRVELLPAEGGHARFREHGKDGAITYEVTESGSRRLVTRIADKALPFGGSWTYELEEAAGGTRLRITEDGEVYNPLFRFLSRFVFGHTATLDGYLSALGGHFGEATVVEQVRPRLSAAGH